MTFIEKHIVDTYTELFEGLSSKSKILLIKTLSRSLKKKSGNRESRFFKSFGAFASAKPAEEIIEEIRSSRKFRKKDLKL